MRRALSALVALTILAGCASPPAAKPSEAVVLGIIPGAISFLSYEGLNSMVTAELPWVVVRWELASYPFGGIRAFNTETKAVVPWPDDQYVAPSSPKVDGNHTYVVAYEVNASAQPWVVLDWNLETGRVQKLSVPEKPLAIVSADDDWLLVYAKDRLWPLNARSNEILPPFEVKSDPLWLGRYETEGQVLFWPDETTLGADGFVTRILRQQLPAGTVEVAWNGTERFYDFAPDGDQILLVGEEEVWVAAWGAEVATKVGTQGEYLSSLSLQGDHLVGWAFAAPPNPNEFHPTGVLLGNWRTGEWVRLVDARLADPGGCLLIGDLAIFTWASPGPSEAERTWHAAFYPVRPGAS